MDESSDRDQPLCPHCVTAIDRHAHFCPACGGPLTSHASTDPLGQVYAEGYAFRQAVAGRPGVMVLAGVWLIFAPQFVGALASMVWLVRSQQSWFVFLTELFLLAMLGLYGAILGKVTLNRFQAAEAA